MMKFYEDAKLNAGAWLRERKERAAVRKMEKRAARAHDPHAHSRFWLLNVPAIATVCAAITEWYWAVLFCIEATGQLGFDWRTSTGSDTPAQGAWHFLFDIQNAAVLFGLIAATIPIVMLSMVWLPVQFAMRGAGAWRRGTIILVGLLANVLVIVSGTVVMNYNRQDQVRESAVVEQTAAQGRAAIDARLMFEQEQLRLALSNSNPYLNQAANVGAAEWERSYVAQARASNDPRLPMLERALGAARAADQRRANIERLTIERATAAPEAATAANVEDTVGRELNTFAQHVEVWRPPFVAFICTLIGIFGAWWTLAMLERLNPKDVLRSGWASDSERIEDLRDEPTITPRPMRAPREEVYDAETGERLVKVKGAKEHFRRAGGKKGQRIKVDIQPDIPPDETGVAYDSGNRIGVSAAEVTENAEPDDESDNRPSQIVPEHQPEQTQAQDDSAGVGRGLNAPPDETHSEPSILELPEAPEDDLDLEQGVEEELAATEPVADGEPLLQVAEDGDHEARDENPSEDAERDLPEPVDHDSTSQERSEPETREERLLPSHIAAE